MDDAAADYRRLIELKPEMLEAYVSLAGIYEKEKKMDEAKDCYEKMIANNPDSATAYLRCAAFRRAHGEFDAARDDCAQAKKKDSASLLPDLLDASILAARGSDEEAVAKAEALLSRAPKNDGQVLYTAVCVWALAARATAARPEVSRRYADRAAALLQECLDKGFHDLIYPEHNRMVDDPALESIRRHPPASELLTHRR